MTKLMSWSAWLATRMMTRAMAPRSTQGRGEVRVLVLVLALVAAFVHYDEGSPRSSSKEPRCLTSRSTSGTPPIVCCVAVVALRSPFVVCCSMWRHLGGKRTKEDFGALDNTGTMQSKEIVKKGTRAIIATKVFYGDERDDDVPWHPATHIRLPKLPYVRSRFCLCGPGASPSPLTPCAHCRSGGGCWAARWDTAYR